MLVFKYFVTPDQAMLALCKLKNLLWFKHDRKVLDFVQEDSLKDPATDPNVPLPRVLVDQVSLPPPTPHLPKFNKYYSLCTFCNKTIET